MVDTILGANYKKKEIPDVEGFSNPFTDESFVLPTSSFNTQAKIQYDRMKSTRKRTSDLIELDPQTAESMLLNIAGAWEEGQLRKEFNDIREGTLKQEQDKAKQKARDKMLIPWTNQMKEAYSNDPSMQRHIQGNWGYGQIMSRFDGDIIKAKAWVLDQPVTERFLNNRTRDSKIYNDLVRQREDIEGRLLKVTGIIADRTKNKQKIPPDMRSMQVHLQKQFRSLNDQIDPKINQVTDELKKIDLMKSMSANVRKIKKKGDGTKGKSVYDTITEGTQSAISKVDSLIDSWVSFFDKGEEEEKPYVPLDDPFATEESRRGATAPMDAKVGGTGESRKPDVIFDGKPLYIDQSPHQVTESRNLKEIGKPGAMLEKLPEGAIKPFVRGESPQSLISGGQDSKVIPSVTQQPSVDLDKMKAIRQKTQGAVKPTVPQNLATSPATGAGGQEKEIVDNLYSGIRGEKVTDNMLLDAMKNTSPGEILTNIKEIFNYTESQGIPPAKTQSHLIKEGENLPHKEKQEYLGLLGYYFDKVVSGVSQLGDGDLTIDHDKGEFGPFQFGGRALDSAGGKVIDAVGWGANVIKKMFADEPEGNVDRRDPRADMLKAEEFQQRRRDERNRNNVKPDVATPAPTKTDSRGYSKKAIADAKARSDFAAKQLKTKHPNIRRISTALQLTEGNDPTAVHNLLKSKGGKLVDTGKPSGAIGSSGVTAIAARDTNNKKINNLIKNLDDDRIRKMLRDPKMNTYISMAYFIRLHKQLRDQGYGVGWSDKDYEDLVSASYNGGAGRVKAGLDESQADNMPELMEWMDQTPLPDYRQIHTHVINYRIHRRGR